MKPCRTAAMPFQSFTIHFFVLFFYLLHELTLIPLPEILSFLGHEHRRLLSFFLAFAARPSSLFCSHGRRRRQHAIAPTQQAPPPP